jgi:hypothetical protein
MASVSLDAVTIIVPYDLFRTDCEDDLEFDANDRQSTGNGPPDGRGGRCELVLSIPELSVLCPECAGAYCRSSGRSSAKRRNPTSDPCLAQ